MIDPHVAWYRQLGTVDDLQRRSRDQAVADRLGHEADRLIELLSTTELESVEGARCVVKLWLDLSRHGVCNTGNQQNAYANLLSFLDRGRGQIA